MKNFVPLSPLAGINSQMPDTYPQLSTPMTRVAMACRHALTVSTPFLTFPPKRFPSHDVYRKAVSVFLKKR
jgi:hypothetical protein